jgi:uncharacterized protein (TIGR02145 family)
MFKKIIVLCIFITLIQSCSDDSVVSKKYWDWRDIDMNCDIEDITIGDQTWAWCNSTLWKWSTYNKSKNCYDYEWNNNHNSKCYWYKNKEIEYNAEYWVDNIWWKLYLYKDSSSACKDWYHLPSLKEWGILLSVANCTDKYVNNWLIPHICEWSWWNKNKNLVNDNIIRILNIPLSGWKWYDNNYEFRWSQTSFWTNTIESSNFTKAISIYSTNDNIWKDWIQKTESISVRCIKDY